MTLTRQHFQMIADTLRAERDNAAARSARPEGPQAIEDAALAFADKLAATNGQFDRARFLKACGLDA